MKGRMIYLNEDGSDNRVLPTEFVNVWRTTHDTAGRGYYAEDAALGKASQLFYPCNLFRFEDFEEQD